MSPSITGHLAPDKVARITGGFYLASILASVLATMLGVAFRTLRRRRRGCRVGRW